MLHSARTHLVLVALLLIFGPFIMLQNYLQQTITALSRYSFETLGLQIP